MHELPHNHSTNPKHVHPLLCVGPYRNTCNNSKPFLDIFITVEIFSLGFFSFSLLDEVWFLPIYNTPKSKSNHTFSPLFKSSHLTSLFITPQPPCLHFLNLPQISSFSFHVFASPKSLCQSLSKNLIHRSPETFSLGCRNCIPSQQLTLFVMTYRVTKTHQKQKHIRNRLLLLLLLFFSAVEALCRQQPSRNLS